MSAVSAICRIAGGILFTMFIAFLVLAYAMAGFTEYGNLRPSLESAISQQAPDKNATEVFNNIYYKNYTCGFLACFSALPEQERPLVMFSAHANAFFKQAMMWSLAGVVVGLALIAWGIRKLFGILKEVGIEAAIAGAVSYVSLIAAQGIVPAEASTGPSAPLISGLFGALLNGFLAALAVGVVLAAVGFMGLRGKSSKTGKVAKRRRWYG